ncbi:MAG: helix-hairpin-helix domain-containing protein, partial [Halobacteriota archaeon]
AVATETEAAASTESMVDEEGASEDPAEAAEPAEAAGVADEEIDVDDEAGTVGDETDTVDDEAGVDVDELKGIGPAYAERLAEIGIETVGDLAAADAEAVAEGASVGEKRAATWIDRAKEF